MAVKSKVKRVDTKSIFGSSLVANEVSRAIYEDYLPAALAQGKYIAAPEPQVVGKGLEYIQEALDVNKRGVSAKKVVVSLRTALFSPQRYRFMGVVLGHRFVVMLDSPSLRSGIHGISSSQATVCFLSKMTPMEIDSGSYVVIQEGLSTRSSLPLDRLVILSVWLGVNETSANFNDFPTGTIIIF